MEIKINNEEASLMRFVLDQLKVKQRTGEIGISHGLDRFVSTNHSFKKQELDKLDSIAKKFGLANGIKRI
jgi:hypothetical protein